MILNFVNIYQACTQRTAVSVYDELHSVQLNQKNTDHLHPH